MSEHNGYQPEGPIEAPTRTPDVGTSAIMPVARQVAAPQRIEFMLLRPEAKLPTRAHEGDLGFDLYATEAGIVRPGETRSFGVGIAARFPVGWGGLVKVRSGHGARGLITTSQVIDERYRGEIHAVIHNTRRHWERDAVWVFSSGDRIAQLVLVPRFTGGVVQVDRFDDMTTRGADGFGSTGR